MIFLIFFLVPVIPAAAIEYAACRFPRYRWWRTVPPAATVVLAALIAYFRWRNWGGEGAPIETLLFFPGLSALGLLAGCFVGWRIWKWMWTPRLKR